MTEQEVRTIVRHAVEEAVRTVVRQAMDEAIRIAVKLAVEETLTRLGMEPDEPAKMQSNFNFLNRWRESGETMRRQGLIVAVSVILSGVAALVWVSITNGGGSK